MLSPHGWLITVFGDGNYAALHSSGFYVAGFEDRVSASVWLTEYLIRDLIRQERERGRAERAQLRLLGQMATPGRPC